MEESVIYQDILRKGELRGELRGELKTVLRILKHRFGALAPETEAQIKALDQDSLDALSIAQIDILQLSDLENWLASRAVQM